MATCLPAEWEKQSAVQLTWPHANSDWKPFLDQVDPVYVEIVFHLSRFQQVLIVYKDSDHKQHIQTLLNHKQLSELQQSRLRFFAVDSNDSWARDHGPISVFVDGHPKIFDFTFNGWGKKYPAEKDNKITRSLFQQNAFLSSVSLETVPFVLEGGSIESDGKGTLLTTEQCLLSPHRNPSFSKQQIETLLTEHLGIQKTLWLSSGELEGDDTDAHVDTLARLCPNNTIAYVQCTDRSDCHFSSLDQMEKELQQFTDVSGCPYTLVPLPMCSPIHNKEGDRLPATYANFLIANNCILAPVYQVKEDEQAIAQLQTIFPERTIVPINCRPLIEQYGSLHCITMQIPSHFC